MLYLIGDVQGCCNALERLLHKIDFSRSRDQLVVLGDLVNRGPDSLGTLRLLRGLGNAATCLLGNHDIHLLAVAAGVRTQHRSDTLDAILTAPDRDAWLEWLRQRRLALLGHGWLMVHAGVAPAWDVPTTLRLAAAFEQRLQEGSLHDFLQIAFGNEPARWERCRNDDERLRFTVNALTRIRFVATDGTLEFKTKGGAGAAPPGHTAWFDAPGRRTAGQPIAFGHWSTLRSANRADLLALDTGCVWGGALTAARIAPGAAPELISVACEGGAQPGSD